MALPAMSLSNGIERRHRFCSLRMVNRESIPLSWTNSLMRVKKRKEEYSQKRYLWACSADALLGMLFFAFQVLPYSREILLSGIDSNLCL